MYYKIRKPGTSARKLFANRANARLSTGPRTSAGKARVARNALRHGFERPALSYGDVENNEDVEVLARMIAGEAASKERHACARRIAAAQLELKQVRDARHDLLAATGPDVVAAIMSRKLLARLVPLNRYEQRVLARRRFAVKEFDRVGRNERRRSKNKVDFSGNKANEQKHHGFNKMPEDI